MKRIHAYLPEEVIDRLQVEATQQGIARSELIRERLSDLRPVPNNSFGLTTHDFHKTVTEVRRRYSYGLDRQQAESIVACVVSILFKRSENDQND
jgi:hypothetical protein